MTFTYHTMQEILPMLQNTLNNNASVSFDVLNPDIKNAYAGDEVVIDNTTFIYRGYKAWTDLAELLLCKMLTPLESTYPYVTLRFEKLVAEDSFHLKSNMTKKEKYGVHSPFFQINKMEEPAFLYYYTQALQNVNLSTRTSILNLGINTGDEFLVIKNSLDTNTFKQISLVGIDHSETAIRYAQKRFPQQNMTFYTHDINDLETLNLEQFDLIISIGTLQSPGINFKPFFMSLVQNYLQKNGAIILGFPNCRWIGGEMVYGAKAPNYAMSEMSLLFNDVIFCKKYLQQHKFRVTITGKNYIFLTATKIT